MSATESDNRELGRKWWKEIAKQSFPDGIPHQEAVKLVPSLVENIGCNGEDALALAEEAGVLVKVEPTHVGHSQRATLGESEELLSAPATRRAQRRKEGEDFNMEKSALSDLTAKELVKKFWSKKNGGDRNLLLKEIHNAGRKDIKLSAVDQAKYLLLRKEKWRPGKSSTTKTVARRGRKSAAEKAATNGHMGSLDLKIQEIQERVARDNEALELLLRAKALIGA